MLEKLLDGKNWVPVVTPLTILVALAFVALACRQRLSPTSIVAGAFGVFVGLFVGTLATGHIWAISTKMALGILPTRIDPWFALPFGLALAIPGYGLAWLATRSLCNHRIGTSAGTSK